METEHLETNKRKKETLYFVIGTSRISYKGYIENRFKDFLSFIIKNQINDSNIVELYMNNFPDRLMSQEELFNHLEHAIAEKKNIHQTLKKSGIALQTPRQSDNLDTFINDILNGSDTQLIQSDSKNLHYTQEQQSVPLLQFKKPPLPNTMPLNKVNIVLEINDESNKCINVDKKILFNDFVAIVEAKIDKPNLSFVCIWSNSKVEIDDNDSLRAYLTSNETPLKILCVPYTRKNIFTLEPDKIDYTEVATEYKTLQCNNEPSGCDITCCTFLGTTNKFVTVDANEYINIWNMDDEQSTSIKHTHSKLIRWCDVSPDNKNILTASEDTSMKLWSIDTKTKLCSFKGHNNIVSCCQFNITGAYILSSSYDKTVKLWNVHTSTNEITYKNHKGIVNCCRFSNTDYGKFAVSCSHDKTIKIWDRRQNKETTTFEGHLSPIWNCAYSMNDKYIVSTSNDHEIKVWDIVKGGELRPSSYHHKPVVQAMFINNDRLIISRGKDDGLKVWDTQTGKETMMLNNYKSTYTYMTYFDNTLLLCEKGGFIKLLKLQT
jgi:WD40 repeat protein